MCGIGTLIFHWLAALITLIFVVVFANLFYRKVFLPELLLLFLCLLFSFFVLFHRHHQIRFRVSFLCMHGLDVIFTWAFLTIMSLTSSLLTFYSSGSFIIISHHAFPAKHHTFPARCLAKLPPFTFKFKFHHLTVRRYLLFFLGDQIIVIPSLNISLMVLSFSFNENVNQKINKCSRMIGLRERLSLILQGNSCLQSTNYF